MGICRERNVIKKNGKVTIVDFVMFCRERLRVYGHDCKQFTLE